MSIFSGLRSASAPAPASSKSGSRTTPSPSSATRIIGVRASRNGNDWSSRSCRRTRVAYLLGGQADIIGAPPARDFARLKTRPHIAGETRATLGGWSVILLNNANPPFDDINFRRALAHAIDRKTITEKIYYGLVEAAAVPAPASSWWFDKAANDTLDYDLDKARYYLKQSKYAENPSFELTTSSVPYLLDAKDCVVFLQAELAKLGIEVKLRLADNAVLQTAMMGGEYQAMF